MGYMHIRNLYQDQAILMFKECYALEKIHGTSAHITYKKDAGKVAYSAGGGSYHSFVALFDPQAMLAHFQKYFDSDVVVYGEAYGGKQQGMSATYGDTPRFIVFDVQVDKYWLDVPKAHNVATGLGLEFVDYVRIPAEITAIESQRDRPSVQAERNGCGTEKKREGVVLRPLVEVTLNNGSRVMSKHKGEGFCETKTAREVSPELRALLVEGEAVAEEWVTHMRLQHVLDKLPPGLGITDTPKVISAMVEDVYREAEGEIVPSRAVECSIGRAVSQMWKKKLQSTLYSKDDGAEPA